MLETSLLRKAVEIGAMLGATVYVAVQVRKPDRFAGRVIATLMNQSHDKLRDWGLSHIQIGEDFIVLDVGCGGGRTIEKLAMTATHGKVFGVDYATGSVAPERETKISSKRGAWISSTHPFQTFRLL